MVTSFSVAGQWSKPALEGTAVFAAHRALRQRVIVRVFCYSQ